MIVTLCPIILPLYVFCDFGTTQQFQFHLRPHSNSPKPITLSQEDLISHSIVHKITLRSFSTEGNLQPSAYQNPSLSVFTYYLPAYPSSFPAFLPPSNYNQKEGPKHQPIHVHLGCYLLNHSSPLWLFKKKHNLIGLFSVKRWKGERNGEK